MYDEIEALSQAKNILDDYQSDLDFITIVGGPWRALGVDIEIESLPGSEKKGIILGRTNKVEKSDFTFNGINDSYLINFRSISNDELTTSKMRSYLLKSLIGLWKTVIQPKSSGEIQCIIPDYYQNLKRASHLFYNKQYRILINPKITLVRNSPTELLLKYQTYKDLSKKDKYRTGRFWTPFKLSRKALFWKYSPVISQLYELQDNTVCINKSVLRKYQNHLPEFRTDKSENKVLFVTSDIRHKGYLQGKEWEIITEKLLESLSGDQTIILKPHPRQSDDDIQDILDKADAEGISITLTENSKMCIERLLPEINPDAMVGYYSTSLINSAVIYGIPCFSAANEIAKITKNEHYAKFMQIYMEYFSNHINPISEFDSYQL